MWTHKAIILALSLSSTSCSHLPRRAFGSVPEDCTIEELPKGKQRDTLSRLIVEKYAVSETSLQHIAATRRWVNYGTSVSPEFPNGPAKCFFDGYIFNAGNEWVSVSKSIEKEVGEYVFKEELRPGN